MDKPRLKQARAAMLGQLLQGSYAGEAIAMAATPVFCLFISCNCCTLNYQIGVGY